MTHSKVNSVKRVRLDWTNTIFIATCHLMAVVAIVYLAVVKASPWTIGLGVLWFGLCALSITGGYHRLFSHRTYKAIAPLRAFYLIFGAASIQNSAIKWSSDHRKHHAFTDDQGDPYNIRRGFWWAHIGWVLCKAEPDLRGVNDLQRDRLAVLQNRYYEVIGLGVGIGVPALLGMLWGDPIGACLVAGFLRLVIQWHSTFSINSVAHLIGSQPYGTKTSARNSVITALITLGEGYHNFHHRFQADYRNGVRWFHFDPTKWFVWSLSKVGGTSNLKRTPKANIQRAREQAVAERQAS